MRTTGAHSPPSCQSSTTRCVFACARGLRWWRACNDCCHMNYNHATPLFTHTTQHMFTMPLFPQVLLLLLNTHPLSPLTQAIFSEGYAFSPAPGCEGYTAPPEGAIESYTTFVRSLPDTAPPEVGSCVSGLQPGLCLIAAFSNLSLHTNVHFSACCSAVCHTLTIHVADCVGVWAARQC